MAVNLDTLRNPKMLIIGGIAVVGGLYFASKLNSKKKESVQPEVQTQIQSVADASDLQRGDALQLQLVDAQQKQESLVNKQLEQEQTYKNNLAERDNRLQSDREQFQSRIDMLGSQYGNQISSLQGTIDDLRNKISNQQNTQIPIVTVPISTMPVVPGKQRTPQQTTQYPGVGIGKLPQTTNISSHGSYEQALARERKFGNETFALRNVTAVALFGVHSPWIPLGDWNIHSAINKRRINNGLLPLTDKQLDEMLRDVDAWSRQKKLNTQESSRALFNKWNLPYQAGASQVRH